MTGSESHLFTPLTIRGVTFQNRIVLSPMCQYAALDGAAGEWHFAHYARMAMGGMGGAIVESTAVLPEGRITPDCLGLWSDAQIPGLARIADLFHARGVPVGLQLNHAGRKASTAAPWDGGSWLRPDDPRRWRTCAPSALPYAPGWPVPRALTEAEIAATPQAFAEAARRAVAAGFDFVEIHGAHGYLLHSFYSPLSNRRDDAWGGDAARRMRLPLAVARAVRAAIPERAPVFYRNSCVDRVPGGLTIDDAAALAKELAAIGVDVMDCSAGGAAPGTNGAQIDGDIREQTDFAAEVRAAGALRTMAVGGVNDPAQAEAIIASGKADLVALASELLRDPAFARRAAYALGLERPDFVLPKRYAFYLQFRGQP